MSQPINTRKLNESCDIVEVWKALAAGPLKKSGDHFLATCIRPQNHAHGDRNPSLVVGGRKNIAWCPVCNFYWNPLGLVAEIHFRIRQETMTSDIFYKSCAWLGQRFLGGYVPLKDGTEARADEIWKKNNEKHPAPMQNKKYIPLSAEPIGKPQLTINNTQLSPSFEALTKEAFELLHTYGLNNEIILSSKLGSYSHSSLGDGIVYPSTPENPRALKFKSIKRNEKGKRSCVFLSGDKTAAFGAHTLKKSDALVITGGEEKCLLLHQLGFPAVSPLFGEANLYDVQAEAIVKAAPSRVVLAMDADPAGKEGAARIARKLIQVGLPAERIASVSWDNFLLNKKNGYDLNDLFRDQGADAVNQLIASAPRLFPTLFCSPDAREECWNMADVEPMDIDWLWEPWIPCGMLTILTGDPNAGKTWLALQLCSIISKGYSFPDSETGYPSSSINHAFGVTSPTHHPQPATHGTPPACLPACLYLTYEDHLRATIKKRLNTMDADQSRILVPKNLDGGLRLDRPERIEALLREHHPRIIIFDPLTAALGERTNMNSAEEVTRLLTPIIKLAEAYNCAFLLIRHQSKADRDKVLDRGMGSIAFSGMARSEIMLGRDPEDPRERILFLIKCAEKEAQAISYRCDGSFEWCGLSDLSPQDLGKSTTSRQKTLTRDQAEQWLVSRLSQGPVMYSIIIEEASQLDDPISERTLRRVKDFLNIKSIRMTQGNNGKGGWYWALS